MGGSTFPSTVLNHAQVQINTIDIYRKNLKKKLWQTKFPVADFITNDDSVIPEQQEGWRRGRPCSMSQLFTTQRASTHLLSPFSRRTALRACERVPTRLRCLLLFNTSLYTKRKSTLLTTHSLTVTVWFSKPCMHAHTHSIQMGQVKTGQVTDRLSNKNLSSTLGQA